MSVPHFSGIKYSPTTKIYYRWHNHKLQRFVTTRTKTEHWGWESSDYQDMHGNSANWIKTSLAEVDELITKHNPNKNKFTKI
jgi:hypothetical protein